MKSSIIQEKIENEIDEYINYQINDKSIPCISVTLIGKDQSTPNQFLNLFKKIYHHKNIQTPIPTIDKTLFRVASVSKLFTYVGLLQLVDKNLISLNDPITKYIPNFSPKDPQFLENENGEENFSKKITIFNLIRHTSGLIREPIEGNYFNEIQCDLVKLVETMNLSYLVREPGKEYKYSNAAVAVAGYIIQVVSNMEFEDYIEKMILEPLGMKSSTFKNINTETLSFKEEELRTAYGHMWRYWDEKTNGDLTIYTEAPHTHFGMNPAAGLRTTINDIEKFIQFFLSQGEPLLKKETFLQFITGQPLDKPIKISNDNIENHPFNYQSKYSHGLGIELNEMFGYLMCRHGGAINGFASDFRVLPELGLGIFTCTTLDVCNAISQQVSEYIVLQYASKYLDQSHYAIKLHNDGSLNDAIKKIEKRRKFLKNSINAQEIDDQLFDNISGYWYLPSDNEKDDQNDTNYMEILKSYNGTVYSKSSVLSKIRKLVINENGDQVDENQITSTCSKIQIQIITADRISCNQVLLNIPINYDWNNNHYENDDKLLLMDKLVRDTDEAKHSLKYSKYKPLPKKQEITLPPPEEEPFKELIGQYLARDHIALIFEDNGCLNFNIEWLFNYKLSFHSAQQNGNRTSVYFSLSSSALYNFEYIEFTLIDGKPIHLELSGIKFTYKEMNNNERQYGVHSIEKCKEILQQSLSVPFPFDKDAHKNHNLVDLSTLSNTLKFDIKYAQTDNFLGIEVYDEAKAFLNREAAQHLLNAHNWLVENWNVGIIVYDSYRPWSVTWTFAKSVTDEIGALYVSDPNNGSNHNRGGALDISLYDLSSGKVIEMPGSFDEFSIRSHRSYFGGTSRQRWFKKLLTIALINNSFSPYIYEWWHFDFRPKDKKLPVLNIKFNEIN